MPSVGFGAKFFFINRGIAASVSPWHTDCNVYEIRLCTSRQSDCAVFRYIGCTATTGGSSVTARLGSVSPLRVGAHTRADKNCRGSEMLKRLRTHIKRWSLLREGRDNGESSKNDEVCLTKRRLFARAAVGTASIAGTGAVAKTVVDAMPKPSLKDKYRKDAITGESELRQREFVPMSAEEKAEMVQLFVNSNPGKT